MAKGKTTKGSNDGKINIYIDPVLMAEMQSDAIAEGKKSQEQKTQERTEIINQMFGSNGMNGLLRSMGIAPENPPTNPKTKSPDKSEIDKSEFLEIN